MIIINIDLYENVDLDFTLAKSQRKHKKCGNLKKGKLYIILFASVSMH